MKAKNILILEDYLYNYRENLSSITRSTEKDKIYKNTEKPGYRSIDVRVFLLYYIIYRTADRVELRIVYRNKSKKT